MFVDRDHVDGCMCKSECLKVLGACMHSDDMATVNPFIVLVSRVARTGVHLDALCSNTHSEAGL
jgi:hypothetical protein